jgi:hypothetical protein
VLKGGVVLDPNRRLTLPDISDALIYSDHQLPQTYYVIPATPALDLDDRDRPSLRLLLYVKRSGETRVLSGGQLTLTTVLELAAREEERVKRAIEDHLKQLNPDEAPPVTVRLVHPDWASGKVEVRLTDSMVLTAQPSLFSRNQCVLSKTLNADEAEMLNEEWGRRLPSARIAYHMVMRVAATATGSSKVTAQTTRRTAEGPVEVSRDFTMDVRAATGSTQPITLEGPLWMEGLDRLVTELELS